MFSLISLSVLFAGLWLADAHRGGGGGGGGGGGRGGGRHESLHTLARRRGLKYFGSATDNPEFDDIPYVKIMFSKMFGQVTPSNAMKWGPSEPERGVYDYADADDVVKRGKRAHQIVRGHVLMWHSQMPDWVSEYADNKTELTTIMKEHITTEVTHFRGQLYAWDVVNECFDDNGEMRSTIYYDAFGLDYIAESFRLARALDRRAKLYLNDYNLEFGSPKFDLALSTVTTLVEQGVPIDGVGFQGHLLVGEVPTLDTLIRVLSAFTDLGLEVAFTEVDIRMELPATEEKLAQQAIDYETVVTACLAVKGCVGITVWDFTDKYSWIPGVFPTEGVALPWDEDLQKKPAYYGIVKALGGR